MTSRALRPFAAAAAGFAVAAVTVFAPAPPAVAAATHIGIVVGLANGGSQTACTTSGGTGLAVLEREFTVVVGQAPPYAGFVFTINGQGSDHPDTTHYWSYWHSSGNGSWTYSSAGAGSYTPKAGTVEGWSYVDGSSTATAPPSVTYASLCGSSDPKPAPKPTPTHRRAPAPTHHRTSTAPHRSATSRVHQPASTSTTATIAHSAATRASSSSAASTQHGSASATAGDTAVDTDTATPSGSASTSAAAGTIRAADPPSRKSAAGYPEWGTVLALLVVVALGGAAWLRTRRQSE